MVSLSIQYNDFRALEMIVNDHNIGVIKMEVIRNEAPEDNFLENVRPCNKRYCTYF